MPNQTRTRPKSSSIPRFPEQKALSSYIILPYGGKRKKAQGGVLSQHWRKQPCNARPQQKGRRHQKAEDEQPHKENRQQRDGDEQVIQGFRLQGEPAFGALGNGESVPRRETLLLCDGREKIPPPPKGEQGVGTDPAVPAELAGAAPGNLGQVQAGGALCLVLYGGVLLFSVLPPGGEWHFLPSPPPVLFRRKIGHLSVYRNQRGLESAEGTIFKTLEGFLPSGLGFPSCRFSSPHLR